MRTSRINTYVSRRFGALAAFCLTAFALAGCQAEPEQGTGTLALEIGRVTVSDVATRAIDPSTGYDGVVKKSFVAGDEMMIQYRHGTSSQVGYAVLDADGRWVTYPDLNGGPGTIYIPSEMPDYSFMTWSYTEPVEANGITTFYDFLDATYPHDIFFAGGRAVINFVHRFNLLSVAVQGSDGNTLAYDVAKLDIVKDGIDYTIATDITGRVIAPNDAELKSITVTLEGGEEATADFPAGLMLGIGLHYPITFTVNNASKATVEVGDAISDWNEAPVQSIAPAGYDYAIRTIDNLVAFRDAVNAGTAIGSALNASTAKVIQLADIDLKDIANWKPIGNSETNTFSGTYDGNGYTISNATITSAKNEAGFFGSTFGATLKNIHLRDVTVTNVSSSFFASCGSLGGYVQQSTVLLCSAKGSVVGGANTGGLCGWIDSSTVLRSRSACSVNTYGYSTASTCHYGGFAGYCATTTVVGCSASGGIEYTGSGTLVAGTFMGRINASKLYYCYSTGRYLDDPANSPFVSNVMSAQNLIQYCYSTSDKFYDDLTGTVLDCWKNGGDPLAGVETTGTPHDTVAKGYVDATMTDGSTIRFDGATIWSADDYPYLHYNYAGEPQP